MFYHFIYLAKRFRMRPKVRSTLSNDCDKSVIQLTKHCYSHQGFNWTYPDCKRKIRSHLTYIFYMWIVCFIRDDSSLLRPSVHLLHSINQYCVMKKKDLFAMKERDLKFNKTVKFSLSVANLRNQAVLYGSH